MHYGLTLFSGRVVEVDADNLTEAIALAESGSMAMGSKVSRGRCLEGFDNASSPGRPVYLVEGTKPPSLAAG
jgi:hypothetical protein